MMKRRSRCHSRQQTTAEELILFKYFKNVSAFIRNNWNEWIKCSGIMKLWVNEWCRVEAKYRQKCFNYSLIFSSDLFLVVVKSKSLSNHPAGEWHHVCAYQFTIYYGFWFVLLFVVIYWNLWVSQVKNVDGCQFKVLKVALLIVITFVCSFTFHKFLGLKLLC